MNDFDTGAHENFAAADWATRSMGEIMVHQHRNEQSFQSFERTQAELGGLVAAEAQEMAQNIGALNMWASGLISATMNGTFSDYLSNTAPPKFDFSASQELAQRQEQSYIDGVNAALEALGAGGEAQRDVNTVVGTLEQMQDMISQLLDEINGGPDAENVTDVPGADYENLAAEALRAIFTPEVIESWPEMTVEQRAWYVSAYTGYLGEMLGVQINSLSILDLGEGLYGQIDSNGNMEINLRLLDSPDISMLGDIIDTVTHEVHHQFQQEVVMHPERFDVSAETVTIWRENLNNYIDWRYDPEGYWNQPVERDAREFAENVMVQGGLGHLANSWA